MRKEFTLYRAALERRKDRRFVLKHGVCEILGQPIVFQEAMDGSRVLVERMARYPEKTTPANFAVRLTKRLEVRFLRTDKSHLFFLEDDVAFTPDFEEVLADFFRLDTDLVFFGGNHSHPPRPTDDPKWLKCHFLFDNHAFRFTREDAWKVFSILGEWRYPQSDNWGGSRSATYAEEAFDDSRLLAKV